MFRHIAVLAVVGALPLGAGIVQAESGKPMVTASKTSLVQWHPPVGQLPGPHPIRPAQYEPQSRIIPPLVRGDGEFNGNGPYFSVDVRLYIHPFAPNEVWAQVTATASELSKNGRAGDTVAHGVRHMRVATFHRPIRCILSPTSGTHSYIDTNHNIDTFFNPCANGLLNSVEYVGDTKGHEAGTRTGVLLKFNPILAQ